MTAMKEIKDSRGKSRVRTDPGGESMTVQSDRHLTEIANIMEGFGVKGHDLLDETALQFADVSSFTDLQDAMNQAKEAEGQFMTLPSKVREIFDHDVAVWLDTAHDEEKRDALVAAGFLEPDKEAIIESAGAGDPAASAEAETGGPAAP